MFTNDKKLVLYDTFRYWLSPQDHLYTLARPSYVSGWLVDKHYELLPMGQTITANLYSQLLEHVWQVLKQKEPALINCKSVLSLHDNAKPHMAWWPRIPNSNLPGKHCTINLVPTDHHLFHSLDNHLRGKSFTNEADLQQVLTDFFTPKTPDFYCKGIAQLETLWQKVPDSNGDYFED